jgi:hypothetical protein
MRGMFRKILGGSHRFSGALVFLIKRFFRGFGKTLKPLVLLCLKLKRSYPVSGLFFEPVTRRRAMGGTSMNSDGRRKERELTVKQLLSAISETEYPQYILEAISKIQSWMLDTVNAPAEQGMDPVTAMFEDGGEMDLDKLFSSLESLERYVDLIPNMRRPEGRPDVIVVSVNPPDYECGVRTAIDYAALFNRKKSKRVWVLSDTFIFGDTIHYAAHVDALAEQGVILRFILVTPWGWVEVPLSGNAASTRQFLWHQGPTRGRPLDP